MPVTPQGPHDHRVSDRSSDANHCPTAPPITPPRTSSKSPHHPSIDASPQTRPAPEHDQRLPTSAQETSGAPGSQDQPALRSQASRVASPFFHSYTTDTTARRRLASPTSPLSAPVDPSSSSPPVSLSDFPLPPGYESFEVSFQFLTLLP